MKYNALHCTALYQNALHISALFFIELHCITLHRSTLHIICLNCTALHSIYLNCTALHFTALCCTSLHFTALYCTMVTVGWIRVFRTKCHQSVLSSEWIYSLYTIISYPVSSDWILIPGLAAAAHHLLYTIYNTRYSIYIKQYTLNMMYKFCLN